MNTAREKALDAFREWLKEETKSMPQLNLALHSQTIADALLQPEIPPTPAQIEANHWIECLNTMGFSHQIKDGEHIVEGHGFRKAHVGLKNIVVRIGHFLHFGVDND